MPSIRALALALVAAVCGALLLPAAPALAAGTTYSWQGGISGVWTDAGNWSPNGVPGTGDSAIVDPPFDSRCNTHITGVPSGLELTDLTVDEHAYQNNPGSACLTSIAGGSITVDHQFIFHAGTISSPLTIAATATGTITPNIVNDVCHFDGAVTVLGTLTLADNTGVRSLSLTGGPGITIAAGGTITTQGNNEVSANCCNSPAHIVNNGTLSLGTGTLSAESVEVDQNGTLAAPSGAQLVSSFAPQTMGSGAKYSGAGAWIQQLGQITMTGTQTLSGNFHWILGGHGSTSSELLRGKASVVGKGSFEWAGGEINAALTLGHNIAAFADGANTAVDPRLLAGLDHTTSPAKVVTFTVHGPLSFTNGAGYGGAENGRLTIASDGTLSAAAGTALDGSTITNSGGTVTVASAVAGAAPVEFDSTYKATGGTTSVGTNATLLLDGSDTSTLSGTAVTGGGTLAVAADLSLTGTTTVGTGTTLAVQKHGYVSSTGSTAATVSGPGALAWTGGTFTGKVAIATTGGQQLSGTTDTKLLSVPTGKTSSTLSFSGPTSIAAGTDSASDLVETDAGGAITFSGALSIGGFVELSGGKITTTGTTTVTAGAGEAYFSGAAAYTNTGDLTVVTGTLHTDNDLVQTAGSTTVASGAAVRIGSGSQFRLQGGTLAGAGTITGGVNNAAGTVSPGGSGIGTLTVAGSYTSGASATLAVDVTAAAPDLFAVSGAVTLGGTLVANDLNGYVPATGKKATVATGSTLTKRLTCVQTTGAGATSQHWTAAALHGTLVLTSVAGEAPTC